MRPSRPTPADALAVFRQKYSAADDETAVENAAAQLIQGAEVRARVDPTAVAHKFGARVLNLPSSAEQALPTDRHGELSVVDGRWLIRVPADIRNERRRFSIAHEIGHILLYDAVADRPPLVRELKKRAYYAYIEILCNQLAARILMPTAAFRGEIDKLGGLGTPDLVADLADTFWVSQGAVARRIVELEPSRRLIIWDWSEGHPKGAAWRTADEQDRTREPFIPSGLSTRRLHPNVVGEAAEHGSASADYVRFESPTISAMHNVHAHRARERLSNSLPVDEFDQAVVPTPRIYLVGELRPRS